VILYILSLLLLSSQGENDDVVKAVLDGTVDVGFVRSGHVERTIDPSTGKLVDTEKLKTLDPRIYIMDNGELFPFLHSTPTFPEWPVFARADIDRVVAQEVQSALLSFSDHKKVGDAIYDCLTSNLTSSEQKDVCRQAPPAYFYEKARCDTTREIAEIARQAGQAGSHNGFRTPKSYFNIRTMQAAAGFIQQDERGTYDENPCAT
jgi:ABC-type phosphate/phosphonate transport system substrate-binding protein